MVSWPSIIMKFGPTALRVLIEGELRASAHRRLTLVRTLVGLASTSPSHRTAVTLGIDSSFATRLLSQPLSRDLLTLKRSHNRVKDSVARSAVAVVRMMR